MIDRLAFRLPDFTRIAWASAEAQATWGSRAERIREMWPLLLLSSVESGMRRCALLEVPPRRVFEIQAMLLRSGLTTETLDAVALPLRATLKPTRLATGQRWIVRLLVGWSADVCQAKAALQAGEHDRVGTLFGYPACCIASFAKSVEEGYFDTTWLMADGQRGHAAGTRLLEVEGPLEANILLRWIGVRAVPHLPCSFDCGLSTGLGREMLALAERSGFAEEAGWTRTMLSWPMEWSALHGIAEIRTPVVKIATSTDATAGTYTIRRRSEAYPTEGARGIRFPYRTTKPRPVESDASRRVDPRLWMGPLHHLDNGFSSSSAMEAAHRPISELVLRRVADRGGSVLDLGCGNGALLAELAAHTGIVPWGIDLDAAKIGRARLLLPRFVPQLLIGDLFGEAVWEAQRRYRLAIAPLARLLDATEKARESLVSRLRERCDDVILYAYDDTLSRFGESLNDLACAAGLALEPGGSALCAVVAKIQHASSSVEGGPHGMGLQAEHR